MKRLTVMLTVMLMVFSAAWAQTGNNSNGEGPSTSEATTGGGQTEISEPVIGNTAIYTAVTPSGAGTAVYDAATGTVTATANEGYTFKCWNYSDGITGRDSVSTANPYGGFTGNGSLMLSNGTYTAVFEVFEPLTGEEIEDKLRNGSCTIVTGSVPLSYRAFSVEVGQTLYIEGSGEVTFIIPDDCTVNYREGSNIFISAGSTLTIDAQEKQTGKIDFRGTIINNGVMTIRGGNIGLLFYDSESKYGPVVSSEIINNGTFVFDGGRVALGTIIGGTVIVNQNGKNFLYCEDFSFTDIVGNGKYYYDGLTPSNVVSGKLLTSSPLLFDFHPVTGYSRPLPINSNMLASADLPCEVRSIMIDGRTLYKDGDWNTLCLPFAVNSFDETPLSGATVKELDTEGYYDASGTRYTTAGEGRKKTGVSNGTLNLYFRSVTSMEAGKPYLVKWSEGTNIVDPVFSGVTVSAATPTDVAFDGGVFRGVFDATYLYSSVHDKFYLGSGNKLHYPDNIDYHINAFRAYFDLSAPALSSKMCLFFDDDSTTEVQTVEVQDESHVNDVWTTLDGRTLSGKPSQPGIYLNGGRKVMR